MSLYLKRGLLRGSCTSPIFISRVKTTKGACKVQGRAQGLPRHSGVADKALYYIGESYTKLGETALARDAWVTLIKNFPDSPFTADANDRLRKG